MLNPKLENKILFDYVMLLVFLSLQLKHITAVRAHEYLGIIFIILVFCHLLIHRDWIKNIFKAKKNVRFAFNIILFVSFLAAIISGIMLSVVIFSPLGINYDERWFLIHIWSGKVLLAAVFVHLFHHRKMIRSVFRRKKDSASQ